MSEKGEVRRRAGASAEQLIARCLLAAALAGLGPGAGVRSAEDELAEARLLLEKGRFSEAEGEARRLLAGQRGRSEGDPLQAASVLDILVEALWRGGKAANPESGRLAAEALEIKQEVLGPDHLEVAKSLSNQACLLHAVGDHGQAEVLHRRALAIRERALGSDHPQVAASLDNLGLVSTEMGDYAAARSLHERALAIRESRLGPEDPAVADAMTNLANVLSLTAESAAAESLYERALLIRRKAFGAEHPKVAASLENLAIHRSEAGRFEEAKPLYEQALEMRKRTLGPDHPDVAAGADNLAILLTETGDYVGAREHYQRALEIRRSVLGLEHVDVALSLHNLGDLAYKMGDYSRAEQLNQQALEIKEEALGPDHPFVASTLNNLAVLYKDMGNFARAKPLHERALAIWEKAFGRAHPRVAVSLGNLADLFVAAGAHRDARQLYERALAIWEESLGAEHPHVASNQVNLGDLLVATGDPAAAMPLYERAQATQRKLLGHDHPDVAASLNGLARARWAAGETSAALDLSLRAEAIAREQFRSTARGLAEREALRYGQTRASGLEVALSGLASIDAGAGGPGVVGRVWDELVRSRAVVLDEMATRHRASRESGDPEAARLLGALDSARARLARLLVGGSTLEPAEAQRRRIAEARETKEGAERALAVRSAAFRQEQERARVGLEDVAASLPAGSALVAYVQYNRLHFLDPGTGGPPGAKSTGPPPRWKKVPSYLALVLGPGRGQPTAVPLGASDDIEERIRAWREEVTASPRGIGAAGAREEGKARDRGERLRRAIWDPLARLIAGARQVFVVPDGALNLVSFAALPAGEGRYLVESGPQVHYLSAERDLVRSRGRQARGEGLLVLGGPDFDAVPSASGGAWPPQELLPAGQQLVGEGAVVPQPVSGTPATPPVFAAARAHFRGQTASCADFRALRFRPLPSSRGEAEDVEALWVGGPGADRRGSGRVRKLMGALAQEAAFKEIASAHRVVHIATHGFFVQDNCQSALDAAPGGLAGEREGARRSAGDNPLLLSGLALAGANRRAEIGKSADAEDGILTVEEIASLDLSGVEWVVLSACETGVGRVQAGEGVLGLRRAFEVGGVGTLIMSLWSVEDASTRGWMRELYRERLSGKSTAEAVRRASLSLIEARRSAGRSTHPFFWGAFVAAGDWE